jgi:hypothetical protein
VKDAAPSRHPLDIARADHTTLPGRVAMRDLALVDDRDGLKPAVRMLANPPRAACGRKIGRACIVEQQKRAQCLAVVVVCE